MGVSEYYHRDQTILVVEDAEAIRKMVCAMLLNEGFRCLEAGDGIEALDVIRRSGKIHLMLTDVIMPQMGGPELARHVAALHPEVRIIFMSGYTEDPTVRRIACTSPAFLQKPFTAAALTGKVRRALEEPWEGLPHGAPV